ncbi:response regulator [Desulfococcaceae bacterium HSG8]|nr:response regulator [Desulfococcaceae bacterium HSG8]
MSKTKILVADDSPTHLRLTSGPLLDQGYEVVTATDGEEALRKAESEKPDLAVLDVVMPKLNGFKVCRQIKSSPELKDIKVILCTSKNQESDKFWGEKQGADAYVVKPFDDQELLDAVAKLL